jgi:hypothetical protein
MMESLVVALAAVMSCSAEPAHPDARGAGVVDSSYQRLFDGGVTFAAFLERAERRKEQWNRNYSGAVVPDALVARARAVAGPWRLLVVAVDGCSDSVNTIPYVARLADLAGVEVRVIDDAAGRAVMDSHKTPDGRGATPTVILLDGRFEERGCFIERPAALRQWMDDHKAQHGDRGLFDGKMKWYDDDKGQRTIEEIVSMIEAAGAGGKVCGSPDESR